MPIYTWLVRRRAREVLLAGSLAALCGLVLAGCSMVAPAPASTTAEPSDARARVSGETGDLHDARGAIGALSDFVCQPDEDGTWAAEGNLSNATDQTLRYLVTVNIIDSTSHRVLASADAAYEVKPGAIEQVAFSDIAISAGAGEECVPRVVGGE